MDVEDEEHIFKLCLEKLTAHFIQMFIKNKNVFGLLAYPKFPNNCPLPFWLKHKNTRKKKRNEKMFFQEKNRIMKAKSQDKSPYSETATLDLVAVVFPLQKHNTNLNSRLLTQLELDRVGIKKKTTSEFFLPSFIE